MSSGPDLALPKFTQCLPTGEPLDYVDLENLDLSLFDNDATRIQLAAKLLQGANSHGFFTITNHGIPKDLYTSQVDLAHALLTVPLEEKLPYETTTDDDARGRHIGFKSAGSQKYKKGFHKTIDHYSIPATNPASYEHPDILHPHMAQTNQLICHFRQQLVPKLLFLVSMILEVPEEEMLSTHASNTESCSEYLRYLLYNPRPVDGNVQFRDLWLRGHTDWGSFTFQFSQPVSALQILLATGEWKWVRYLPGAIVVNVGEALEIMTGGLFRATLYRVVKPPVDQEREKRVGILYFAMPVDGQRLGTIDSPLLQRLGLDGPLDQNVFTMSQYLQVRKNGCKRLDFDKARGRRTKIDCSPKPDSLHINYRDF